jgi:RNA 2',3'-cyclic 3'-phosphodiesterase
MRVFIGLDLPQENKLELKKLLKTLQKKHWKVNWENPEKLHLTLAFLNEINKKELKKAKQAVFKISKSLNPFNLKIKGVGVFPDFILPQTIFLFLKGDLKSLSLMQKILQRDLKAEGFNLRKKPFVPHFTLGRIKARFKERQEIGRQLKALRVIDLKEDFTVKKITIFQSRLSPKGSSYTKLYEEKI